LLSLAAAAAAVGDPKWCRRLGKRAAALIPPTLAADWPVEVRRGLVQIATTAGAHDLAYAIAWAGRDEKLKTVQLRAVSKAMAGAGRAERARAIASAVGLPGQPEAMTAVPPASLSAGETPQPGTPVHEGEHQARASTAPVRALIAEGKLAEAGELARTIPDIIERVQAFIALVSATASQDHQPRSRDLAEEAARWAETLADPYRRARTLAALTEAVTATGDPGQARDLADRTQTLAAAIGSARLRADVLACLIRAMARTGDYRRCRELARATGPERQDRALVEAVLTAAAHDLDGVSTLTGYIGDPPIRASALIAAARLRDEPDVIVGLVATALRYGSWTLKSCHRAATGSPRTGRWSTTAAVIAGGYRSQAST
ncbi:MAG TPA: hypothetical protein VI365_09705, partial [Trebonia sp.]